ncbi:MAG: purine-nucleoside phosphorylase [Candidatus Izemoplasmataceae bacterium]
MDRSKINTTVNYLKTHLIKETPKVVMVLGSGVVALKDELTKKVALPFSQIPNFNLLSVKGHQGELIYGYYKDVPVLIQSGRNHYYEGLSMEAITYSIGIYHALGIKTLVLTNACGGINQEIIEVGDIIVLDDFINLLPVNPLIGDNDDALGPRFPDMTEPFNQSLKNKVKKIMESMNYPYKEGVYACFQGPYYETRAEIRMIKSIGADLVGMSTVPETIYANYLGMDVLAFSIVTNMATGIQKKKHSHDDVVKMANASSEKLKEILKQFIQTV